LVFTHRPDHQTREIVGVDELSQRRARSPDGEGLTLLLAQVASVDESGNNMAVIEMKVVMLAKNIRRNDRGEVTAVLGLVHAVLDVHHALGVRVTFVREVRRPVVNHGFVNRKRRLVRKDARRKARDELFDPFSSSKEYRTSVETQQMPSNGTRTSLMTLLEDVVIHRYVVSPKFHLVFLS